MREIQAPVFPLVAVGGFLGFQVNASLFESSDAGQGVVARDVGLAPAPPKQFELSVVLGDFRCVRAGEEGIAISGEPT